MPMRSRTALVLAAVALFSSLVLADIAPSYPAPEQPRTSIAGLQFVLVVVGEPIGDRHPGYVFLTGCTPTHPNCRLATQKDVLGWAVTAVNGVTVEDDLDAFVKSFRSTPAGQKVRLTLEYKDDAGTPPKVAKLVISFDPQ
jgi:hypothetical protein